MLTILPQMTLIARNLGKSGLIWPDFDVSAGVLQPGEMGEYLSIRTLERKRLESVRQAGNWTPIKQR